MGLVSGKVIMLLLAVFVAFGWSMASGLVKYGPSNYECYEGKSVQPVGPPQRWLWVGKVQLYYQPWEWSCDLDHRYDPGMYRVQDGLLAPKKN